MAGPSATDDVRSFTMRVYMHHFGQMRQNRSSGNLIKAHIPQPIYKIDSIIREHGQEILRLPPYQCELNPKE